MRSKVFFICTIITVSCFFLPSVVSCQTARKPVQYRLRQIMAEPVVSERHEAEVLQKAERGLQRALAGEDFTRLAQELSEEPGADRTGGDLGFFTRDRMVKPFSDAVFSMKPEEIAGPEKTQFGFHIIKLLGIRGDERHARHILFSLAPDRADSLAALRRLSEAKEKLIEGESFDKVFREYNTNGFLEEIDGYMVWQKSSDMLDSFARSIEGLREGGIAGPFESILGFHIVLVDSINYDENNFLEGLPPGIGEWRRIN